MAPKPTLLQQAVTRFDWVDLRGFAPHSNAREAGQATSAITLSIWHSRQRFCPTCGAAVRPALAGWAQRCTNEADGNRVLFPRVEPAVITAHRGRARPSAAATQRGMEGFEAVFGVRRICGGGGEP